MISRRLITLPRRDLGRQRFCGSCCWCMRSVRVGRQLVPCREDRPAPVNQRTDRGRQDSAAALRENAARRACSRTRRGVRSWVRVDLDHGRAARRPGRPATVPITGASQSDAASAVAGAPAAESSRRTRRHPGSNPPRRAAGRSGDRDPQAVRERLLRRAAIAQDIAVMLDDRPAAARCAGRPRSGDERQPRHDVEVREAMWPGWAAARTIHAIRTSRRVRDRSTLRRRKVQRAVLGRALPGRREGGDAAFASPPPCTQTCRAPLSGPQRARSLRQGMAESLFTIRYPLSAASGRLDPLARCAAHCRMPPCWK
jgi:hypothetical protein